nr:immunoglobulin heavy chain junction region [Mus musculus]NSM04551.1 immunoglobulin heavy chain junction region [Mus musculus]NSM07646.1 immunoglobulin heavy chain junction region [Mus musculus]
CVRRDGYYPFDYW